MEGYSSFVFFSLSSLSEGFEFIVSVWNIMCEAVLRFCHQDEDSPLHSTQDSTRRNPDSAVPFPFFEADAKFGDKRWYSHTSLKMMQV
ncbi:hypothetical protein CEXT_293221 [Caerostris extrusa]|uniref:Uncharacterized protein n=1 Tax=Caerostris extrusa TaxID=172846 RepID=A0AAV4U8F7_CAEEX|nr:hypothetical protein CEXT_293221 [Caerostris extrusa]